jgi:hypothetical protein
LSFRSAEGGRSGELAAVDRQRRAGDEPGLVRAEPDSGGGDGGLAGKRKLTAALKTYETEVAGILGGVLRPEEQQMSDYFARLLTSIAQAEAT